MAPNKAPVDAVGGTQDRGPWPDGVDEIVEGEQYDRPVEVYAEIRCSEDGTTFSDFPSARDHCDADHGGDYSVIETEKTTETRTVTVFKIQQIVRGDGTPTDGYVVDFEHDRLPGGS